MLYRGSPLEALQRASEVLSAYWELVTMSDVPVDWRCQHEYTETFSSTMELSTESSTQHFTGGNYLLENTETDSWIVLLGWPLMWRSLFFLPFLSPITESYVRKSAKTSHRRPVKDLYKLGFIIASVCGGLLFLLTLYCLITQKVPPHLLCYFLNLMCPNAVKTCIPVILQ